MRELSEDKLAPMRGLLWGCTFSLGMYVLAAVVIAVLLLW